ncbi:hypothetical protein MB818_15250, partial [Ruegeria sp. 1NDH52C]
HRVIGDPETRLVAPGDFPPENLPSAKRATNRKGRSPGAAFFMSSNDPITEIIRRIISQAATQCAVFDRGELGHRQNHYAGSICLCQSRQGVRQMPFLSKTNPARIIEAVYRSIALCAMMQNRVNKLH